MRNRTQKRIEALGEPARLLRQRGGLWTRPGVCGLLVLGVLLTSCSSPPTVGRITIANRTDYNLDTEVTGRDRESWLPLAIVEARSEAVVQEVIDQGETWIFRFVHRGRPVGEVSLTRAELERSDWRVEVPEQIQQRFQQPGSPPSG
jgi:hypothetical protein